MDIRKKHSRRSIAASPKLHVEQLRTGLSLGYRKGAKGYGSWTARLYKEGVSYLFRPLGLADDLAFADGIKVLSFDQAADRALAWATQVEAEKRGEIIGGVYTVAHCLRDYLAASEAHKGVALERTRYTIESQLIPALGSIMLANLRKSHLQEWFSALGAPKSASKKANDPEAIRKRRASANRIWTVLRAALNWAYKHDRIANKSAWERISPYKNANAPRVRWLTAEQVVKLIEHCPSEFRPLIQAAAWSGARYGEICRLTVGDFHAESRTLHIARSKSGKTRDIPLTDEAVEWFKRVTAVRSADEIMFTHTQGRHAGEPWTHSQQRHWMLAACEYAEIKPAVGFHCLRHSYASLLAMNDTPMPVIAKLLGHADGELRMVSLHYGHLSSDYVSDTLRAKLPSFAVTER
jgi:integrase